MKKLTLYTLLFISCLSYTQVGINTTEPDASAILDVESTTQGFLPPRMTTVQRDAIAAPAEGLTIYNTTTKCIQWFNGTRWYDGCNDLVFLYSEGTVFCSNTPTAVVDVINPTTGRIWMDRNLGALQVATTSTDANSYGDLYQWGRLSDGHQCRASPATNILSINDQPENENFILATNFPEDWRSPQNENLWQGINGVNNPCPNGYRLPTSLELLAERQSWSTSNAAGALASPLKLPLAGGRSRIDGSLFDVGSTGFLWSSTTSASRSRALIITNSTGGEIALQRAIGLSVRCIKNE